MGRQPLKFLDQRRGVSSLSGGSCVLVGRQKAANFLMQLDRHCRASSDENKYLHLRFGTNEGWAAVSDYVLQTPLQGSKRKLLNGLLNKLFLRTGRVASAVQNDHSQGDLGRACRSWTLLVLDPVRQELRW